MKPIKYSLSLLFVSLGLAVSAAKAQFPAPSLTSSYYTANPFAESAGLYVGQCTWFVYGRIQEAGVISPSVLAAKGVFLGNAATWANQASSAGFTTGTIPQPGAIAVWTAGAGHVAFVEQVVAGQPQFSECNASPAIGRSVVVCRNSQDTGGFNVLLRTGAGTANPPVSTGGGALPKYDVFAVVGGPTSANGFSWYHLQGNGYDGWAAWLDIKTGLAAIAANFTSDFTAIKLQPSNISIAESGPPTTYIYLASNTASTTGLPGKASSPLPLSGAANQGTKLSLNWTAGTGATSYELFLEQGTANISLGDEGNLGNVTKFTTPTLTPGVYHWQVNSINSSGTTTGDVWTFTVGAGDTAGPNITIFNPADGLSLTSPGVRVNGSSTDNGFGGNGVSSVVLTLNGVQIPLADGGTATGSSITNWDANITLSPGVNIIKATGIDFLNNSNSTQVSITYNAPQPTSTPVVVITSTSDPATGMIDVSGYSQSLQGVDLVTWLCEFEKGGASGGDANITVVGNVTFWTISGIQLQPGNNTIVVTGSKKSGPIITGNSSVVVNYSPVVQYMVTSTAGANGNVTPVGPQSVVSGSGVSFTATPNVGYQVNQWTVDGVLAQAGNASFTVSNVTAPHSVQVTFTPVVISGTAPKITFSPASQTITAGQNAAFGVAATGTPKPNFQWQISLNSGSSWSNLTGGIYFGTQSANLTIIGVNATLSGVQYRALAINALGTTPSKIAALTVNSPAALTGLAATAGNQSVNSLSGGNLTVVAGVSATFTAGASGNALKYQWQLNGRAIPGATSATYSIAQVGTANAGIYTVLVSNPLNSKPTPSKPIALNVQTKPTIITQLKPQTVIAGRNATLTVVAAGIPSPSFLWTYQGGKLPSNCVVAPVKSSASSSTSTLNVTKASQSSDQGTFQVTVRNGVTTSAPVTSTASITVK
jgi:surface antigen